MCLHVCVRMCALCVCIIGININIIRTHRIRIHTDPTTVHARKHTHPPSRSPVPCLSVYTRIKIYAPSLLHNSKDTET